MTLLIYHNNVDKWDAYRPKCKHKLKWLHKRQPTTQPCDNYADQTRYQFILAKTILSILQNHPMAINTSSFSSVIWHVLARGSGHVPHKIHPPTHPHLEKGGPTPWLIRVTWSSQYSSPAPQSLFRHHFQSPWQSSYLNTQPRWTICIVVVTTYHVTPRRVELVQSSLFDVLRIARPGSHPGELDALWCHHQNIVHHVVVPSRLLRTNTIVRGYPPFRELTYRLASCIKSLNCWVEDYRREVLLVYR